MTDVEKVIYILKRSFHEVPNDRALTSIAETIIATIRNDD